MSRADKASQVMQESERSAWNKSVDHPLQSWEWGQFRKAMGIDVVRLESWQITFHRIPHTPWVIGYFPKGPAITGDMLASLRKLGRGKNAVFIQLEPNVEADSFRLPEGASDLRRSHHPLFTNHTFILDLTKPESELLAAMHSKTRYNLRVAQKHNVTVTEDNSDTAFAAYLALNEETTSRQGFYAHNKTYHQTMWKIMRSSGVARLFTASYQGKILAAWIIFCWNKTIYYPYGTSSRNNREVMAPTLMLWEIARWGAANGYERFDLWGALGATPDPNDPWFGFHRFKQGFNPRHVEFAGSFDLVIQPLLYRVYTIGDTIRWFFLKRKA
ncbi:peptidoglycan bridge formation glycyltransferase FemA/FemB family protein [Candidatus Gottesmanbacteria bacterium]|nr:peptidoglycan bridge formation glycyltransferase FemA/FemB family protein [Candidatus Gottesmanbacteria bacterium]